jgi:hypothetical protein
MQEAKLKKPARREFPRVIKGHPQFAACMFAE